MQGQRHRGEACNCKSQLRCHRLQMLRELSPQQWVRLAKSRLTSRVGWEREGLAYTRTSVPNDFGWAMFFRGAESATERRVRRSRAAATTWQIEDYRKAGTVCGKRQRWSRLLSVKCALPLWHVTPLCQHDHNLTLMLSSFPSSKPSLKNEAHSTSLANISDLK